MKDREFKYAMYDGLSKLLKAIGNPYRLEIIEMLSQGEKSVEGIVQTTSLTFANASQHLQVLKNNNIVKSRKEKQYVYYSLINDEFLSLYQHVMKYAVHEIAELEKTLNEFYTYRISLQEKSDKKAIAKENKTLRAMLKKIK